MLTRSLIVNTLYQALGKFGSAFFMFGATLILARSLGGDLFGEFTTIVTYLALFYMGVDLGLNQVFLHFAGDGVETDFEQFFLLRFILGLAVSLVAVLGMFVLTGLRANYSSLELSGVAIGAVMITAYAVTITMTVIFQKRRRYDMVAVAQGVGSLVTLVGVFFLGKLFAWGERGVLGGVVWWTLGTVFTAGLCVLLAQKQIKFAKIDQRLWVALLKRSAPLALALLFNHAYVRWGILSLSWHRPAIEVGQYGLAFKFFEVALSLPVFFMNSYYPDLLELPKLQLARKTKKLLLTLLASSFVVAVVLFCGAPLLKYVRVDFAQSSLYLRGLSLLTPIFFVSSPLVWLFVMSKRQQILTFLYSLAFLVFLVISPGLVETHGASGAIVALGVTEVLVLVGGWGYLVRLRGNL